MKPVEFVEAIIESVIDSNLNVYQNIFKNTNQRDAKDLYWANALKLFKELSDEQRKILFTIIRQVEVDTVSKFLSIIDGVTQLENQSSDFILTIEDEDDALNGDLQDIFLELENNK